MFEAAKLKSVAKSLLKKDQVKNMDDTLEELSVQGKFKDVICLEEENTTFIGNWD